MGGELTGMPRDGSRRKKQEPRSVMTLHWDEEGEWYDTEGSMGGEDKEKTPDFVVAVDRLKWDVEALMELTTGDEPCVQKCRAKESISAFYLVGDASGNGMGSDFF